MFSDALTAAGMIADQFTIERAFALKEACARDNRLAELDAVWRVRYGTAVMQHDSLLARHNALVGQYNGLLDTLRQAEADRNATQVQADHLARQLAEAEARNRALQDQVERLSFSLQRVRRQAAELDDNLTYHMKARGLL